ncbi:MAG TPA: hypothetical protein VLH60_01360 [Sedimentisphaerales bacterium]|nr:hypothetical protein [Sedimentisphaerales bacterium]
MAAPKAGQSGSSLPAILTLTALFLIAAVAAVVFYMKAGSYRTEAQNAVSTLNQWVSRADQANWVAAVGEDRPGTTRVGEMIGYVDEITRLALGHVPADSSVESKLNAVKEKFQTLLNDLSAQVEVFRDASVETTGMLSALERMKDTTIAAKAAEATSLNRVAELSAENLSLRRVSVEKEEQYAQLVQQFSADATNTQNNFVSLQDQMGRNAKDMVAMVEARLAVSEETARSLQAQLEETRNQLAIATEKSSIAKSQLAKMVPPPDTEVAAFRPDGQIISIDNQAGLVYINLGVADRVYRGLTFTVYDKGIPIPRDGIGKAQIEVLEPRERMSIARIAVSNPRQPVMVDDAIANLVWESNRSWVFVVAGEFDLDGSGRPRPDGIDRVKALITKWGGTIASEIGPLTDFVVLGGEPRVPLRPSGEEVLTNPAAMQIYESAMAAQQTYRDTMATAKSLSLPIFNLQRLMYMTGYEAMSPRGSVIVGDIGR